MTALAAANDTAARIAAATAAPLVNARVTVAGRHGDVTVELPEDQAKAFVGNILDFAAHALNDGIRIGVSTPDTVDEDGELTVVAKMATVLTIAREARRCLLRFD
jgi:hypothetical protein